MKRYLNEFVRCECAPDLLAHKLFPNAKEITETFAAYNAVRTHLKEYALDDPTITVYVVGDGHTPRTAATFALRSAWWAVSVDPKLTAKSLDLQTKIKRLDCINLPAEEVQHWCFPHPGKVVVVAVHSHAKLESFLCNIRNEHIAVVAIPCCVPQVIVGQEPDIIYRDEAIWSPHNEVKIWRDIQRFKLT